MKSYEEIAKSVFEKRDAHREKMARIRSSVGIVTAGAGVLCVVMLISIGVLHTLRRPLDETVGFGGETHSVGTSAKENEYKGPGQNETVQADKEPLAETPPDPAEPGNGASDGESADEPAAPEASGGTSSTETSPPQKPAVPEEVTGSAVEYGSQGHSKERLLRDSDIILQGKVVEKAEELIGDKVTGYEFEFSVLYKGETQAQTVLFYALNNVKVPIDEECIIILSHSASVGEEWPDGYYIFGGSAGLFGSTDEGFANRDGILLMPDTLIEDIQNAK